MSLFSKIILKKDVLFIKEILAEVNTEGGIIRTEVVKYEESDRQTFSNIYYLWRELSDLLRGMGGRAVNIPDILSEGLFCLEQDAVRVVGNIPGANSFDCYDLNRQKRIQIKACSVLPDLTSFGPKSVWDELYFLDFCRETKWDGTFDIYKIDNDLIYSHKVNTKQTFLEQQKQSRRPRLSIYSSIIQKYGLMPIKRCRI